MEKVYFKLSSEFRKRAEKLFEEQKARIQALLPDLEIEHIGGTIIPNMLTKGDLDINVRVTNEHEFKKAVEVLKSLYEINQPDNWTVSFASFKDDTSFQLPFGVQLTIIGSSGDHFVKQREILLKTPDLVESFNTLKLQYQGKNMEDYRVAKDLFLKENSLY